MKVSKWRLRLILLGAITLLGTFAGSYAGSTSFGRWVELRSYDLCFSIRGPLPESRNAPITIIAIDEKALTNIPDPLMLWHRVFARVLDHLVSRGVAAIGIDFIFADVRKFDPEGERMLSESLLRAGAAGVPIVLGYRIRADGVEQPAESVRLAALAAGHSMGYANLTTDIDDFVRRQQILSVSEDKQAESGFALAIAEAYAQKLRRPLILPDSPDHKILINYRGRGHYRRISFADVLQTADNGGGAGNSDSLRDQIVLIGRIGQAGDEDLHSTPQYFSSDSLREGESIRTPGVEIHANTITTLLDNSALRTLKPLHQLGVAFLLILAATLCCLRLSPAIALPASSLLAAGFLGYASHIAFGRGLWVQIVAPLSGIALAISAAEIANYMLEGREKRKLRNLFKRYVNDTVIEKILQSPQGLVLVGQRKPVTVLFADIRDFTTRSEKTTAEILVRDLNEYFTSMVAVIQRHNGMVDKFIGDGLMAIFGTPLEDAEAAVHSVQAALAMSATLTELNRDFERRGILPISIGIGIHSGEAIVGNIGSPQKMEYTAIGDVVNVASRIEGLNKKYGTYILLSGETNEALQGKISTKPLGKELVKGRGQPISLYTV